MDPKHTARERSRIIETPDGAALRVLENGPADAQVTVVLGHGWTLGSGTWRHQVDALCPPDAGAGSESGAGEAGSVTEAGAGTGMGSGTTTGASGSGAGESVPGSVRVVRWEQRGHCGSTLGTRPLSIDLLGEDLGLIIDTVAPHGRLVLGGHSMGGMTIMALAAARPELIKERVDGVALVSTSAGHLNTSGPGNRFSDRLTAHTWRGLMALLGSAPTGMERLRGIAPPRLAAHRAAVRALLFGKDADPAMVAECADLIHGCHASVISGFYPSLMSHDKIWKLAPLRETEVVVVGGSVDLLTPPRHGRALVRALPDAHLEILPGLGHMVPQEAADRVSRHLLRMSGQSGTATPRAPADNPARASASAR